MARYYYMVYVDVPEDMLHPTTEFTEEYHFEANWNDDDEPYFPAETLAKIVMGQRLGPDEDYGFDYTIDYERKD